MAEPFKPINRVVIIVAASRVAAQEDVRREGNGRISPSDRRLVYVTERHQMKATHGCSPAHTSWVYLHGGQSSDIIAEMRARFGDDVVLTAALARLTDS